MDEDDDWPIAGVFVEGDDAVRVGVRQLALDQELVDVDGVARRRLPVLRADSREARGTLAPNRAAVPAPSGRRPRRIAARPSGSRRARPRLLPGEGSEAPHPGSARTYRARRGVCPCPAICVLRRGEGRRATGRARRQAEPGTSAQAPSIARTDLPSFSRSARQAAVIASAKRSRAASVRRWTKRHGREWWGAGAAQASATSCSTVAPSTAMDANCRTERRAEIAADTGRSSRTAPVTPRVARRRASRQEPVCGSLRRMSEQVAEVVRFVDVIEQGVEAYDL